MDVDVLFTPPEDHAAVDADLLAECLAWAAAQLQPTATGLTMTVLITDAREISRLHDQFFGDPSVTDVVSFPSGEQPAQAGAYIGDVAVCLEVAEEQALEAGHSRQREVVFLALHGLLHLLGHDDQTANERQRMLDLQECLLVQFESEVRNL